MAKIELTNDQLHLIQKALDLYSRIGILQFDQILDHPTIYNVLQERHRPKKVLEVGDKTERGEIVEINKKFIKTKGSWGNGEEIRKWDDVENVKLSTDWSTVHKLRDELNVIFSQAKGIISGENYSTNGSYGIHNKNVDDSCREAYDIIQVIRHEFWKADPNRNDMTVDSSCHFTSIKGGKVPTVEIDVEEYLKKMEKWRTKK